MWHACEAAAGIVAKRLPDEALPVCRPPPRDEAELRGSVPYPGDDRAGNRTGGRALALPMLFSQALEWNPP